MTAPALDVQTVTLAFGGLVALSGANLKVAPREIHGIIGPNGAGKTTMFDIVTGVYRPSQGSVLFGAEDVTRWAPHRRARAGLARSFQTVGLSPGLTARDNVLATIETLERVRVPFPSPRSTRRRRGQADELLDFFGLQEVAGTQVTELPLGTSKLLELAKVFACEPKVVLLDEPFAGLSTGEAAQRVAKIAERRMRSDTGVVIVEHHVPLLLSACDTLTVLDAGQVVASGDPRVVMSDPAVREAYMGEVVEETAT